MWGVIHIKFDMGISCLNIHAFSYFKWDMTLSKIKN